MSFRGVPVAQPGLSPTFLGVPPTSSYGLPTDVVELGGRYVLSGTYDDDLAHIILNPDAAAPVSTGVVRLHSFRCGGPTMGSNALLLGASSGARYAAQPGNFEPSDLTVGQLCSEQLEVQCQASTGTWSYFLSYDVVATPLIF
jgi:hypothetical protein